MAEEKKDGFSTMNLTIVSVIALVALVSVVALTMSGRTAVPTYAAGSQLVSAGSEENVGGRATQSWGGLENDWSGASGGSLTWGTGMFTTAKCTAYYEAQKAKCWQNGGTRCHDVAVAMTRDKTQSGLVGCRLS